MSCVSGISHVLSKQLLAQRDASDASKLRIDKRYGQYISRYVRQQWWVANK